MLLELEDLGVRYRETYTHLGSMKRAGLDVDGNMEADRLRTELNRLWLAMSPGQRQPFLGPGTMERVCEGPVDRQFSGGGPKNKLPVVAAGFPQSHTLRVHAIAEDSQCQQNGVRALEDG